MGAPPRSVLLAIARALLLALPLVAGAWAEDVPPHEPGVIVVQFVPELYAALAEAEEHQTTALAVPSLDELGRTYGLMRFEKVSRSPYPYDLAGWYVLRFPADVDEIELAKLYAQDEHVIEAKPDYIAFTACEPRTWGGAKHRTP